MLLIIVPIKKDNYYPIAAFIGTFALAVSLYIFCRSDSERKSGMFIVNTIYALLFFASFREGGFELFVMRSHSCLLYGGIFLGKSLLLFNYSIFNNSAYKMIFLTDSWHFHLVINQIFCHI